MDTESLLLDFLIKRQYKKLIEEQMEKYEISFKSAKLIILDKLMKNIGNDEDLMKIFNDIVENNISNQ